MAYGMVNVGAPKELNYGICSTSAGITAKTVNIQDFILETGKTAHVKFSNTNTVSSPTLNVSSTGAKSILYKGASVVSNMIKANVVYEFMYDGSYWNIVGEQPWDAEEKAQEALDTLAGKADTSHTHTKADITGLDPILFGECTSANTATAKIVNIPGFELKDGTAVLVRFKNGHKAGTNLTLNINSTGAKDVLVNGVDGFGGYSSLEMATVILLTYSSLSDSYICVTPNNVDYANLAGSADGLSTGNTGSETEPVYFKNGEPVACDMYNYQKNPIQRIGTWLDGTPIWRYAFDNDLDTDTKNHIKNYHELQILPESKFSDPNEVFTLNAVCYLRSGYYNCYIDDPPLSCGNDGIATVAETTANRIENYSGYYGYIELVANGSNIKK